MSRKETWVTAEDTEYLVKLAKEAPKRFDAAWERQVRRWLGAIHWAAGRLRDEDKAPMPSVFHLVEAAMATLRGCGAEAWARHERATRNLLTTECCRCVARAFEPRLYRGSRFP